MVHGLMGQLGRTMTIESEIGKGSSGGFVGRESLAIWKRMLPARLHRHGSSDGGLTGVELAEPTLDVDPDQRIVIASGYADVEGIATRFSTLTKPFLRMELARALREPQTLGSPATTAGITVRRHPDSVR